MNVCVCVCVREREREWGHLEKSQKVERKDTRSNMFGNCNKILYRFTLPQISSLKYAPVTSCDVEESFFYVQECAVRWTHELKWRQFGEISCFIKNKNVK